MTSARRIAANRRNAHKSTGPKTERGKASTRLNALRHGFAGTVKVSAGANPAIERLAKAIAGENAPAAWYEQAVIIAETDMMLRKVRAAMAAEIEREPPVSPKVMKAARILSALKIVQMFAPPTEEVENWPDAFEWALGLEEMSRGKLGRIIRVFSRGARAVKAHQKKHQGQSVMKRETRTSGPAEQSLQPSAGSAAFQSKKPATKVRDIIEKLSFALPALVGLRRYEQRLLSRQRRAIQMLGMLRGANLTGLSARS